MTPTGFTFKGIHSSNYAVVQTQERPIRPAVKTYTIDMPNSDGTVDFTEANGIHYEDTVFSADLQVKADSLSDLHSKLREIADWLTGSGTLVFDDDTEQEYTAVCYEGLSYVPEIYGRYAKITVNFRVKPWL